MSDTQAWLPQALASQVLAEVDALIAKLRVRVEASGGDDLKPVQQALSAATWDAQEARRRLAVLLYEPAAEPARTIAQAPVVRPLAPHAEPEPVEVRAAVRREVGEDTAAWRAGRSPMHRNGRWRAPWGRR